MEVQRYDKGLSMDDHQALQILLVEDDARLRDIIDRDFEPRLLHTIRGVGYILKVKE